MNQSLINVASLLKNPHLRYPVLAVILIQVAKIWFPAFEVQLNGTQKIITYYLIAAAANSGSPPPTSDLPSASVPAIKPP